MKQSWRINIKGDNKDNAPIFNNKVHSPCVSYVSKTNIKVKRPLYYLNEMKGKYMEKYMFISKLLD